jgi:Domain of unknown function (DUF3362)
MGRADLIGNGKHHLIPAYQPVGSRAASSHAAGSRAPGSRVAARPFRTQHTGLPQSGRGSPRLKTRAKP